MLTLRKKNWSVEEGQLKKSDMFCRLILDYDYDLYYYY